MNYRHQFHAGNFADVWKHALLLPLFKAMQRKEKGFLFLDTHAGRGSYDLAASEHGDSLQRKPEYPDGIGRLWKAQNLPPTIHEYVELVRRFDRDAGNLTDLPRFYPGSPWIARMLARPQDRMALCELHEAEEQALQAEFRKSRGVSVQRIDGYTAVRAMLPPPEKRALVLIDPPFEEKGEFNRILAALREALRRMPAATVSVWYPLTERAGADHFLDQVAMAGMAPCLTAELTIAGPDSPIRLKGCGVLIVNPPWQIEADLKPVVQTLPNVLAQEPGGDGRILWLVKEI
jgi:23S rRNA (adenine2030-N6)-methyltransferase